MGPGKELNFTRLREAKKRFKRQARKKIPVFFIWFDIVVVMHIVYYLSICKGNDQEYVYKNVNLRLLCKPKVS